MNYKKVRMYVDEEGRRQATLAASERLEDELCDFCSQNNPPYKVYPCKDFPHPLSPDHWSRGGWNACKECAELVDAEDVTRLAQRCVRIIGINSGEGFVNLVAFHVAFFNNRIMPQSESAPPEPKGDQPGSHEPPASSHNQGGDFPSEDLSK